MKTDDGVHRERARGLLHRCGSYYVIGHTWGEIQHPPMKEQPAVRGQAEI